MKKKLSRILGVGLTLALLTSLLLTAAPAIADISQPTVDVDGDEISADDAEYTLSFRINTELVEADDPVITVKFPDDTDVSDVTNSDVTIEATSGIGSGSGTVLTLTATSDPDDDTILEIELDDLGLAIGAKIGAMAYIQVTIDDVINPSGPDTYTLEVMTSEEDSYVESEEYDIGAPTVGGFVYVYNPSDILLATYGGQQALNNCFDDGHFANDDYTIKVGPGTYVLDNYIDIYGEGVTLVSSDGAEDTIIDGDGSYEIYVDGSTDPEGDDVTIDGFTLDNGDEIIYIYETDGVTVQNCIITDDVYAGIYLDADENTTIKDCVIEDSAYYGIYIEESIDATVSNCEISGTEDYGAIVLYDTDGVSIKDCNIHENDADGILFEDSTAGTTISGCTITMNEDNGINTDGYTSTELVIVENTITDNEAVGIYIDEWTAADSYVMFNAISGNEDAIYNDSGATVNAQFNWWGSADEDDFEGGIVEEGTGDDINYEPWLLSEWATVISGYAVAAGDVASLDGKDECGVSITSLDDDTPDGADIICAFAYKDNPKDALADVAAFYDIFMIVDNIDALGEVNAKIKLYDSAITDGSTAYFWTGDFWAECSDQDARNGIIYITLTEDTLPTFEDLEGTAFAVVAGEATTALVTPVISTPESGEKDVSLKPTFGWEAVADADGYYFQLADNANFVLPLADASGDMGRLNTLYFAYAAGLDYSEDYYWRVKAVSGKVADGSFEESAWGGGVFFTMAEVIEEPEPEVVWTCPQCGLTFDTREALEAHVASMHPPEEPPEIVIQAPDVVVPLPAETPITPGWIYAIIGVGAVLVIAVIVLIVRTRRVV